MRTRSTPRSPSRRAARSPGLFWLVPRTSGIRGNGPATPAPGLAEAPITDAERAMLDALDGARRLWLLRFIVPGLLAVTLLAMPAAIISDVRSGTIASSVQMGLGLGAFAIAQVAVLRRRVHLAALAFFTGLAGVIVLLLLYDSALNGPLHLVTMPEFALLTLPIVVAGVFAGPWLVGLVTFASVAFTVP